MKQLLKNWIFGFLDKLDLKRVENLFLNYLDHKKQLNQLVLARQTPLFVSNYNLYHQAIPDRYSDNLNTYKKNNGFFDYKDISSWIHGNYQNNIKDLNRFFFINLCIDYLLEENIIGNVAELGVYKGNSAFLLAKYANQIKSKCYLFDTFNGFDSKDLVNSDANVNRQLFTDTSLDEVKSLVGESDIFFIKGFFPDSLNQITEVAPFSLVHIDCDLEKPFKAALNYFYPRLKKGGFLILHDHSSLYWPGATKAISDFFSDKPEFVVPVPDKSGTCVIRKV